jgi:hypothetical protein
MSKALRLSEKWFRRGLWLVAFVFAGFLIGLGGTLVGDLPKVEKRLEIDDFLDRAAADRLREGIKRSQRAAGDAQSALEQARLKHRVAQSDTQSARETFNNWLATLRATQLSDQDPELVARSKALDGLRQAERDAQSRVEQQEQLALNGRQGQAKAHQELQELERVACSCTGWRSPCRCSSPRAGCSRQNATAPTGLSCGASSSSRCSPSLSSSCLTCPATAAMCATSWASW